MAIVISGASALAILLSNDWGDTGYRDTGYRDNSWPELHAYCEGKEQRDAELRAWHRDREKALWPDQRRLQDERYLLTLSSRKRSPRSTARPRHSFVVRHRSRQVRIYI